MQPVVQCKDAEVARDCIKGVHPHCMGPCQLRAVGNQLWPSQQLHARSIISRMHLAELPLLPLKVEVMGCCTFTRGVSSGLTTAPCPAYVLLQPVVQGIDAEVA
jgi:hypothetical protein